MSDEVFEKYLSMNRCNQIICNCNTKLAT